jgi:hypothetical protein
MDPLPQITSNLHCLSPLHVFIMEQPSPWALRWNGLRSVEELQAYGIMIIDVKY